MATSAKVRDFFTFKDEFVSRQITSRRPLQSGGGGGNSGDMESRVAILETKIENIAKDVADVKIDLRAVRGEAWSQFRWQLGFVLGTFVTLLLALAKGFHWI